MENMESCVPWIDITIDEERLFDGAKNLMQQIRRTWHKNDIICKAFAGYTNKLVSCTHKDDVIAMEDVVVVRCYGNGTDLMIDREKEIQCAILFHRSGCAAPVFCRFNNGVAYGYVTGTVIDFNLVHDRNVQRKIARELAHIHSINPEMVNADGGDRNKISLDYRPSLFQALDNFLQIIPEAFDDDEKQSKYRQMSASRVELKREVECLRNVLPYLGSPVVLCHNDLLFDNILYNRETQKVYFIDFEYAAFNYQAFDIATHFWEFVGMKDIDFSRYPDRTYQLNWLRIYLEAYLKQIGRYDVCVTDSDVEILYQQVRKFTLGAHLFWGMWALTQATLSTIDYDYLDYARIRLSEYYAKKDQYLQSEPH